MLMHWCITFLSLQSIALFQRKVKSLEDELAEAKSSMEESRAQETQWRAIKYETWDLVSQARPNQPHLQYHTY